VGFGGTPAPVVAGTLLEVADVLLELERHRYSVNETAAKLGLSRDQVIACQLHFLRHPQETNQRLRLLDLSFLTRSNDRSEIRRDRLRFWRRR
jgi:uncharacterized protein (DUF433 family)